MNSMRHSPNGRRDKRLRILHVNTLDRGGGAERNSLALAVGCREAGHTAWLAVGEKMGSDPNTLLIPDERSDLWARGVLHVAAAARKVKPARRSRRWLKKMAFPRNYLDELRGREDFHYPQTARLLTIPPELPDLVHAHNLHGGYFDLRRLPKLSRQVPFVVTLRDEWLLTGHCAYTGSCQRWLTGCGQCPDLSIYPAIRRDATARNWKIKSEIYANSRLFLTAPSRWLLEEAQRSMLASAIADARVIPNGIDVNLFRPADRGRARAELALPEDQPILFTSANRILSNRFKDWATLRKSMEVLAEHLPDKPVTFVVLGERGAEERIGRVHIRFVPYEPDSKRIVLYYQAADLFLHAARSENFPTTVLEALACGTPVIATAVRGIPEQVRNAADPAVGEAATGVLVPGGDAAAMAHWIAVLLDDAAMRTRLGANGRADAEARFGFQRMLATYLDYYGDALDRFSILEKGGTG